MAEPRHGSQRGYRSGCRCERCSLARDAKLEKQRATRGPSPRRAGKDPSWDTTPTRSEVYAARGWT